MCRTVGVGVWRESIGDERSVEWKRVESEAERVCRGAGGASGTVVSHVRKMGGKAAEDAVRSCSCAEDEMMCVARGRGA